MDVFATLRALPARLYTRYVAPARLEKRRSRRLAIYQVTDVQRIALANLAAIYRLLPPEAQARVRVIFISLDERDSPAALKNYVPFFNERFIAF